MDRLPTNVHDPRNGFNDLGRKILRGGGPLYFPLYPEYRRPTLKARGSWFAMTMVAAFQCSDGIIVAADTQHTSSIKLDASKIFCKKYKNGVRSIIAFAGRMSYGRMAMQHIENALESLAPSKARVGALRKLIEGHVLDMYAKHVFPNPHADLDDGPRFDLVVALWSPKDKRPVLFSTEDTAVMELLGYVCIGSGQILAHSLIRPKYNNTMTAREVRPLAITTVDAVKDYVTGCGGFTELAILRSDGRIVPKERLLKRGAQ